MADLKRLEEHFSFGENWRDYSRLIDEARITQAASDMEHLLGGRLDGKSLLDIGCGSGLHALAALRLGSREVVGIDIDPQSVATTQAVLDRFANGQPARTEVGSVFELPQAWRDRFDVVYSWGVLHHTGDMWRAIGDAAAAVAPGGQLALALYRRTMMCDLWRLEKRWYTRLGAEAQRRAREAYVVVYRLRCLLTGRDFDAFVANYKRSRGMDFYHDVHDWLGGFPYESVRPAVLTQRLGRMGFVPEYTAARGLQVGLLGSGCDEFTFRRQG